MKTTERRNWIKQALAVLGAVGLSSLALRSSESEKTFSADFGPDWEVQKAYTLETAEAMPAEKYSFKPAAEMRSFGEVLAHIAWGHYGFAAALRGVEPPAARTQPEGKTKENIIPYLKVAFDYAAEAVAGLTDAQAKETVTLFGGRLTMTKMKVCQLMRDHTTHHRGYLLPYLRLNGAQPPRYRFSGTRPSPV